MTKAREPGIALRLILGPYLGQRQFMGGPERRAFFRRAIALVVLVAPAPPFVAGIAGRRRKVGPPATLMRVVVILVPPAALGRVVVGVEVDTRAGRIPGDTNFTNFVNFGVRSWC